VSANPDFTFRPEWSDLLREFGDVVPAEEQGRLLTLVHALEQRDRLLADFINENVRRIEVANLGGDGTAHPGTAWATILPTIEVDFTKARKRTNLVVTVMTNGRYTNAGGGWVEFGVRMLDPDGNLLVDTVPVCRREFEAGESGQSYACAGAVAIADVPTGPMSVRVRVRADAAGTTWGSESNGTNSLVVTESR
jgi:hypothetical protein